MVDEEEERMASISGAMIPASHSRLSTPDRDLIHFVFFCMLRDIDFIEVDEKRQVGMFHNRALNLFFDDVVDLFILIDTTGGYKEFIRNGVIEAKGKLFPRPESLLSFFKGVTIPATEINVRIDNHDRRIIGNFIECFEKNFGPFPIRPTPLTPKIRNFTLSYFLMRLWKMMLLTYRKRHFRDSVHKDTVELRIFASFL